MKFLDRLRQIAGESRGYACCSAKTSEEMYADTAKWAAKDFAGHVIKKESESIYYCGKPGTGIMSFRVVFLPGAILIYGDIGELILTQHNLDLPWLCGSVHSRSYFFEKSRNKTKAFCAGDAAAHLDFLLDSYRTDYGADSEDFEKQRAYLEAVWEKWDVDNCESYEVENNWYLAYSDYDSEVYVAEHLSSQDIWCWEAAKWFVENLKRSKL